MDPIILGLVVFAITIMLGLGIVYLLYVKLNKKRILILENNKFYREIYEKHLTKKGYFVYNICEEKDGYMSEDVLLQQLKICIEVGNIKLVIIDLNYEAFISTVVNRLVELLPKMKFIYLTDLSQKFERRGEDLSKPWLSKDRVKDKPQVLVNLVKQTLSES